MTRRKWPIICPGCREPLGDLDPRRAPLTCAGCQHEFSEENGIWRFLPPDRLSFYRAFLDDYNLIRRSEGRLRGEAGEYIRLPELPQGHPLAWQGRMRRITFEFCRKRLLPQQPGARILDLGAGVGWLSHRLARAGHFPCAVDLNIDEVEGLGASSHYGPNWPRLQAEFDRLPLADGCADAAVFNASLQYSVDYPRTLREALRVVRPGGWIVALEVPVYTREADGRRMVEERHREFERLHGIRSDALPLLNFMTWETIRDLSQRLKVEWRVHEPFYGWKWLARPLLARLRGEKPPAQLLILSGRKDRS